MSLAKVLKSRGHTVVLFTDERAIQWVDSSCVDKVIVSRFRPSHSTRLLGKFHKRALAIGLLRCGVRSIFSFMWKRPNAVIGFGGYPSAPTILAAQLLNIPSVVHECNAILGRANAILMKRARAVTTGFPTVSTRYTTKTGHRAVKPMAIAHQQFTGNPVSPKILRLTNIPYSLPSDGVFNIFIMGGSQGASLFSRVVPEAIKQLAAKVKVRVIMQTRDEDISTSKYVYEQARIEAVLAPFFTNIDEILQWAHIVISRSGALSLAEIATAGVPSVLVPLANSLDGDQLYNAMQYEENGAAIVVQEHMFTTAKLVSVLDELCHSGDALIGISQAVRKMYVTDAAERLAMAIASVERKKLTRNKKTNA
jgi:UDP-N-acetylglucosamine--N-acetylmuramyl-(pentapeptide) pyrophosphoryl-undecaprenol N-acetylglucosamine transferase